MKAWLIQLIVPWVVLALPWSVAAYQRRWGRAMGLFVLWSVALGLAFTVWSGPGILLLAAVGAVAVVTTSIEIRT